MNPFERRRRQFDLLGALVLLSMTAAVVALTSTRLRDSVPLLAGNSRRAALVGLCGLVGLFLLYIVRETRRLARLEDQRRQAELREGSLRARISELSELFDDAGELAPRLDLGSLTDLAAQRLRTSLEADLAVVLLFHPGRGCLLPQAAAGGVRETDIRPIRSGDGVAGIALAGPESLVVTEDPLLGQLGAELGGVGPLASGLVVPIVLRGAAIGVIALARLAPGEAFEPVHAGMVERFAGHCAAAIARTTQYQRLAGEAARHVA